MTYEDGINWLADTLLAELRASDDEPEDFWSAKFDGIQAVFVQRGWTELQRARTEVALCKAIMERAPEALMMPERAAPRLIQ